jgi:hypothetical protein
MDFLGMLKPKSLFLGVVLAASAQIGIPAGANAAAATYDFEAQLGSSTPFSITNNGVTATFTSPADPGGFIVVPTFLSTLPGNTLADGPAGLSDIPLDIAFSEPIASISLLFALDTSDATIPLNLTTNSGGSTSAAGSLQPSGLVEGSLSFSGTAFTSIELSTTAPDFAVDDITVTTSEVTPTPEPGTWSLLVAGLGGLAAVRRRKSRSYT